MEVTVRLLSSVLLLLTAACSTGSQGGFPWTLKGGTARPGASPAEVKTLGPARYNRIGSRVLARRVSRPTLVNLDYAAYHANMVIRQQQAGGPIEPGRASVPRGGKVFGGVTQPGSIAASAAALPLTAAERGRPMAFSPLVDYLARWNADKASGLEEARASVRGETWGLPRRPGTHFQEITTAWIHRAGGKAQLWVKIEFEPWAHLFKGMPDEDGDGYPEIYAQLRPGLCPPEVVSRIEEDYAGKVLTTAEVHGWANQLASYWYPSYNTDVVKLEGQRSWPLEDVEPEVIASTKGLRVQNPTVVIRGKPQNRAVYNIFVVDGVAPLDGKKAKGKGGPTIAGLKDAPVTVELEPVRGAIEAELKQHKSWAAWAREVAPIHAALKRQLERRPKALKGLVGRGGFLFYRRSLDAVVGGDIQKQPPAKNPFAAIVEFKDYLKRLGVDFLLVPVPTKADVFPDKLARVKLPGARGKRRRIPVINPFSRKFILELNRAGVEVVDLLPVYLKARARKLKRGQEPLYQPQDTHWTDRGLRLAARVIGRRIKRYPWYPALRKQKRKHRFKLKRTTFRRKGDLVSRLSAREQRRFRPAKLFAHQVLTRRGKLFEDDASSPIVVLGDSFTGVYQRTDCGSAGISAHVAHQIRNPVDLVMSYGGGPNVRNKLLTRDEKALKQMRLLIWLFAARDFFNYWDDWAPLKQQKKQKPPTKKGGAGAGGAAPSTPKQEVK
jgi:alginate O-acetyltransferase complex protein AlgJ